MILNFNGDDDIQEEDDAGLESERAPAATAAQKSLQESSKKVEKQESLKQKSNALYAVQKRGSSISTSNQAGMTDESLANEDDIPKRNNHLDVAKKNRGMTSRATWGKGPAPSASPPSSTRSLLKIPMKTATKMMTMRRRRMTIRMSLGRKVPRRSTRTRRSKKTMKKERARTRSTRARERIPAPARR